MKLKKKFYFQVLLLFLFPFFAFASEKDLQPDETILIPMRDGVKLPTDIYYPENQRENLPCILIRSPAGRKKHHQQFLSMAKWGYVVAVQDTRSIIDVEGKTLPYITDGWGDLQDGYDTVEWLANHPMTNGKIGTIGYSALGITQLLLAPANPPHLICQYIGVAAPSLYQYANYQGGKLRKSQVEGWLGQYAKDPSIAYFVKQQCTYSKFWECVDSLKVVDRVQVPAVHIGGWFDIFSEGTIDAFVARQEKGGKGARGKQILVMGPWTHFWTQSPKLGDFTIPEEGRTPPIDISPKRWFDFYLKGINNGVDRLPPITYYVMGPFDGTPSKGNIWRHAEKWPIPAVETPFYLTVNGKLEKDKSKVKKGFHVFRYDPDDPAPTIGGRNLVLEAGPKDQRELEERNDVFLFTTPVLEEDLEVTGNIKGKIYLSTSCEDTDLVIRLTDVYPDGRSILIADGIAKLTAVCAKNQEKTKPQLLEIDLWSTSMVFAKGHKIRISISSSNYPRFEKGLNKKNDEGEPEVALNTIYMGDPYPSHIILPIVEESPESAIME